MLIGYLTFFITISRYNTASTKPPLSRPDLMRRPLVVPSKVQWMTVRLLRPPEVSLPMDMPWPWRKVQLDTVMSWQQKARPATAWPALRATLSSHTSRTQSIIRTFLQEPGSMASVLGESAGAWMVTWSIRTSSQSTGTRWKLGELRRVTPRTVTPWQWEKLTILGRRRASRPPVFFAF